MSDLTKKETYIIILHEIFKLSYLWIGIFFLLFIISIYNNFVAIGIINNSVFNTIGMLFFAFMLTIRIMRFYQYYIKKLSDFMRGIIYE